jgi:hypothetical protein
MTGYRRVLVEVVDDEDLVRRRRRRVIDRRTGSTASPSLKTGMTTDKSRWEGWVMIPSIGISGTGIEELARLGYRWHSIPRGVAAQAQRLIASPDEHAFQGALAVQEAGACLGLNRSEVSLRSRSAAETFGRGFCKRWLLPVSLSSSEQSCSRLVGLIVS